jgi:hypothetical protein
MGRTQSWTGEHALLVQHCVKHCERPSELLRSAPPGSDFEWRSFDFHVTGHLPFNKTRDMKRNDVIDAFIALFRQAIRRRYQLGIIPYEKKNYSAEVTVRSLL